MTRIKICGITNLEDAQAAVAFGADALGFIAVPESPRHVSPENARVLFDNLWQGPFVATVFVARRIADAADYPRSSGIQFYERGEQDAATSAALIRVLRIKTEQDMSALEGLGDDPPLSAVLLDAHQDGLLGGVGKTFDWRLAVESKRRTSLPLILAGGLTPENVADALEQVRPYAVDVSSGVEAAPGRKDYKKLKAFIDAVRAWDSRQREMP